MGCFQSERGFILFKSVSIWMTTLGPSHVVYPPLGFSKKKKLQNVERKKERKNVVPQQSPS